MVNVEFHTRQDGSMVATVHIGNHGITMDVEEWKKTAAQILRAMPSDKRSKTSRANGAKPVKPGSNPRGRPRKQS